MAVRMHERQKLENKFEALFRRYDDVTVDVTRVAEAAKTGALNLRIRSAQRLIVVCRIAGTRLAAAPEIPKAQADDPHESIRK